MPKPFTELTDHEQAFVRALVEAQDGNTARAEEHARNCLLLLKDKRTMEETASGHVVKMGETTITLPDLLHTDTAQKRFCDAGISV